MRFLSSVVLALFLILCFTTRLSSIGSGLSTHRAVVAGPRPLVRSMDGHGHDLLRDELG